MKENYKPSPNDDGLIFKGLVFRTFSFLAPMLKVNPDLSGFETLEVCFPDTNSLVLFNFG